jgi:DNA-3-methyladenine glycosylase I
MNMTRCAWCGEDPLYTAYHDREWGVPLHDDRTLFEFLVLEGAQAGLSWITILRKRDNYRQAFEGFDIQKVAGFDEKRILKLLADPGIVRNRMKIEAAVQNARAALDIQKRYGSLDTFFWRYVDGRPVQNAWCDISRIPARTDLSLKISKDLKQLGCRFVGPTICYALMQAIGMVNDHVVDCFRHQEINRM